MELNHYYQVRFIHPDSGMFATRQFDFRNHSDRVAASRFLIWALHHAVELRMIPLALTPDMKLEVVETNN